MLRIMRRNPERIPMDRLAEYLRLFADLLGAENHPVFKGIKRASTGLRAAIPLERQNHAILRLVEAKSQPESRPGRVLRAIEDALGADSIKEAQLLDSSEEVIYLFSGHAEQASEIVRLYQSGSVDGAVTGLVGADDTMHLHLRDHLDRDLRFVIRNEPLARELLMRFRQGRVRLAIHGTWVRAEAGWMPEASKCTVDAFADLDEAPLREVFASVASIDGNGWSTMDDPNGQWESLRGLQ